jgi:3-oxoacyl-[acyl-carrier protein] reductase
MRLQGRIAIVTGAAQGIGRAYALRFAREGAHVIVADVRDDAARTTAAECEALGRPAMAAHVDVSDEASTRALAARVEERFGRIDVLVNNAALYHDLDRTQTSRDYFDRVLAVNLTGVWLMSRAVERTMKRQRKGKIVNQSSTAAYLANVAPVQTDDPDVPMPSFHYSVAKVGVGGLTKFMAGALGPWGITVNAIAPGPFQSRMMRATLEAAGDALPAMMPLKRIGRDEDMAGAAIYLASRAGDYVVGSTLVVDGGVTLARG